MKFTAGDLMCVSIPEPRQWEMEGRQGVSYKVDLSDGVSTVQLACKDINVYQVFRPFKKFTVQIELLQTSFDGRKGVKAQIFAASPAGKE